MLLWLWYATLVLEGLALAYMLQNPSYDPVWFAKLKSAFLPIPPAITFKVAWTVCYACTFISYILLVRAKQATNTRVTRRQSMIRKGGHDNRLTAMTLLHVYMSLNFVWSVIFFQWHRRDLALVDSLACLVTLGLAMYYAKRADKYAFFVLIPHMAWLSFGTLLGVSIWMA
mgnify:FL=1